MKFLNKSLAISFAVFTPLIVAVGAYYMTVVTPILLIVATIFVVVLVALDKINGKLLYIYLFGIALAFLWQTTMLGADVVGSDIHIEYYFARVNYSQPWDLTYPDSSNTSIVIGLIAPWLSRLLMVDMLWIFKLVLPVFLACMPLVLFKTFKIMFGEKRAFFATIFFLIIPVYSMEIAQIAKSMVAELFFALMILGVASSWKWQYKLLGITGSLIMMVVTHYTIAIMGICFLIGAFGVRLVTVPFKWELFKVRTTPVFVLFISLIIGVSSFWLYHGYAANASGVRSIKEVGSGIATQYLPKPKPDATATSDGVTATSEPRVKPITEKMDNSPKLVKIGTGFDFDEVPADGKVFRIIQYFTQLLILIGGGWLLYKYKYYKPSVEYLGFATAAFLLLLMCIFIPSVAIIINMTRFYHLSLFFLAPCFVLGVEAISNFRREKDEKVII